MRILRAKEIVMHKEAGKVGVCGSRLSGDRDAGVEHLVDTYFAGSTSRRDPRCSKRLMLTGLTVSLAVPSIGSATEGRRR